MKKIAPLLVLVILAAGAYFLSSSSTPTDSTVGSPTNVNKPVDSTTSNEVKVQQANGASLRTDSPVVEDVEEGALDADVQPATRVYKTADEALAAIKRGAADYDDMILEQFTEPSEDCVWCPEFYRNVRDLMMASGTPPDQMSYYGEILAISGRVENIEALVEGIKNPPSPEAAESFAEALELTLGKEPVIRALADELGTSNERLREAGVAAITNQGSRLAAEILYKHTVERGDPEGYYNLGIGLGEFVPDADSLPYIQELVGKRDQYSHLAVKALLNSGVGGLRMLIDTLSISSDPEFDKVMLKDAIDHVTYEDEVTGYLERVVEESKQPVVVDFAKKALESLKAEQ